MVLAGAVGGPVFEHGGSGRGLVQQPALCRRVGGEKGAKSGLFAGTIGPNIAINCSESQRCTDETFL